MVIALFVASPAAFVATLLWVERRTGAAAEPQLFWDDAARREIQGIVESRYVEPLHDRDARELFDAAMEGYVGGLDPFSAYVPPSERRTLDRETKGSFGGIGVIVASVPRGLRVSAVRRGGPAHAAGVAPGDVIERVDGASLTGRDFAVRVAAIQGDPGTEAVLTLARGDGPAHDVRVVRALVPVDTVPGVAVLPGAVPVGYVRIEQFSEGTGAAAREAVASLLRSGARAMVLDLRGNLGGVVTAAVEVAGLFLPDDAAVCVTRRRTGASTYRTERPAGPVPDGLPVVVLVDEGTASASEILAGALQDHGRAVLAGERTYGKFLVQTLVEAGASGGVVRLTTSRYETPRGRSHPRDPSRGLLGGLLPDVRVPLRSDVEREAVAASLARLTGPDWDALPYDGPALRDPQLEAALALLRGGGPPAEPVARR